jgi:putative hydrolase of the HAD superfamily
VPEISAVVFDWYCTLASPSNDDFWNRLPEFIVKAGGEPVEDALAEWDAYPLEHPEYSSNEEIYRSWQRERLECLMDRCGVPKLAKSRLCAEIERSRYSRLFDVFPDVPAILAVLRDRGLVVGLCSNWDWDLERHLVHNQIRDLFDFIVVSASFGYRKPHPTILRPCWNGRTSPRKA